MGVLILPRCVKYQREHGGVCLPVAYFQVMFEIPIEAVRDWIARCGCRRGAVLETQVPLLVDDEIGFGSYSKQVERAIRHPSGLMHWDDSQSASELQVTGTISTS